MTKSRGTKDAAAELLMARWLELEGWTVHRAVKAAKYFPVPVTPDDPLERARVTLEAMFWYRTASVDNVDAQALRTLLAAVKRQRIEVRTIQHDLFGCLDVLAMRDDATWAIQITTQNGRAERRRKLEQVSWPSSYRVSIASHEAVEDPAHRARRKHFWRVEDFTDSTERDVGWHRAWEPPTAIEFNKRAVEDFAAKQRAGLKQAPTGDMFLER